MDGGSAGLLIGSCTDMKIDVLCSDPLHPILPYLRSWIARQDAQNEITLRLSSGELSGGAILFLISCHEIIGARIRALYEHTLVIHASNLPTGRGWSPLTWLVAGGENNLVITLFEAAEAVDSGPIWAHRPLKLEGHELADEISAILFSIELELMEFAIANKQHIAPRPQDESQATYFPRRTPEHSRLDPNKSIAEQFDLMRVADPERYPSFFNLRGHRYRIKLEKWPEQDGEKFDG